VTAIRGLPPGAFVFALVEPDFPGLPGEFWSATPKRGAGNQPDESARFLNGQGEDALSLNLLKVLEGTICMISPEAGLSHSSAGKF
jgi:hypothetical protein